MSCRKSLVLSLIPALFWLSEAAEINAQALALQSTPEIGVFVYDFAGLSPWILEGAETEAAHILRPARIEIKWTECTSRTAPESCHSPRTASELVVRMTAKALPPASAGALGMALASPDKGTAFIFYDRILALQTSTSLLQTMLGRVLAHEITHLLLPEEEHSGWGLMRGQWTQDDLRFASMSCRGLSARSVQLIQREAQRRVSASQRSAGGQN